MGCCPGLWGDGDERVEIFRHGSSMHAECSTLLSLNCGCETSPLDSVRICDIKAS